MCRIAAKIFEATVMLGDRSNIVSVVDVEIALMYTMPPEERALVAASRVRHEDPGEIRKALRKRSASLFPGATVDAPALAFLESIARFYATKEAL